MSAEIDLKLDTAMYDVIPALKAFKLVVPANFLRPGFEYEVQVPDGVVRSAATGVPARGNSTYFTTLAGRTDVIPPMLMMASPHPMQTGIPGSHVTILLYFSEPIEVGFISRQIDQRHALSKHLQSS